MKKTQRSPGEVRRWNQYRLAKRGCLRRIFPECWNWLLRSYSLTLCALATQNKDYGESLGHDHASN